MTGTATQTYSFGEWLKGRRDGLRLTQRELAVTVHCSVPMIKKIEADERRPSRELAALLAVALKVPERDKGVFVEVARGDRPVDALWQVPDEAAPASLPLHADAPLPGAATPFVGRADELKEIGERLAQPNCRILTLAGPGGVGKTRLALAVAQAHQTAFADGAAFVSLAALTDTSLIPDAVARSLSLTLTGPAAEHVLAYLRRRSLLLVLDNCEQLAGDLGCLSDLAAKAPGVKLLATSRDRLHLAEEWVYLVPGLAQAEQLFVESARRVKQGFDEEAEHPAVARICQLVENLPLAVELAAGWTPLMPCDQIADHIQRDIAILATDVRNIPDRHRSIEAVFDHSWELLSSAEQNALRRLSVFRGGWRAGEALAVAEADLRLLRRLVDKSLVRVRESGRFDLHELVRQYAARRLGQSGDEGETRHRHFDAYLALAEALEPQHGQQAQRSPRGMETFTRFDQEQDNLRAALAWGLETKQTEPCLRLLDHLWFYWTRRGYYNEAGEWGLRAIRQAGELESVELCVALSSASGFSYIQGRFGEGEALAHRAWAMARRLEEPQALIAAYGTYTFASVNVEQALQGLQAGIDLIQETGKRQESLPLFYQGAATWLHSSGRFAEAEEAYRKSIGLFRQMGAEAMTADPLGRLGQLALQRGRTQEAYDLTVESIAAARAAGYDIVFGAWGDARLGLIQLYLGEAEAAQQSVEAALAKIGLFEDGHAYERVKQEALALLSEVALARGEVSSAAGHLQASLEIVEIFYHQLQDTRKLEGMPDALPVDLMALCARAALVAAAQGQPERAVTLGSLTDTLRRQSEQNILPPLQTRLDETLGASRTQLPDGAYDRAWKAGQTLSLAQAFAFLLDRPLGSATS